ncbi:hypothetical protein T439DRAFT_372972 [Meredithblackwellia eburnea MCA 4105]
MSKESVSTHILEFSWTGVIGHRLKVVYKNIASLERSMKRNIFCYCLPLRLGVAVFSFATALGSAFVGGLIWIWWQRLYSPNSVELSAGLWCSGFGLFALSSLLGFLGSLLPHRLRLLICLYENVLIAS